MYYYIREKFSNKFILLDDNGIKFTKIEDMYQEGSILAMYYILDNQEDDETMEINSISMDDKETKYESTQNLNEEVLEKFNKIVNNKYCIKVFNNDVSREDKFYSIAPKCSVVLEKRK